ncbi:MAG: A/G-specific adenine glycosylase [Pseudomonadota bacterium]
MREQIGDSLLSWYDKHARDLPWRVHPSRRGQGATPDPYRVWLSEIMLQQTTVAAVDTYFRRFTQIWPAVTDLAAAEDARVMGEWAGLGYYARARNLLKCARVVTEEYGGRFPSTEAELLKLPGVGPYTAAAIAAIAFQERAVVVDGNVERVMARLCAIQTPLPKAKPEIWDAADGQTPQDRPGDYAQAVMDLGATICTPRNPSCLMCPVRSACEGHATGVAAELPRKVKKAPKPTRMGEVYLVRNGHDWLLERRPAKGLLGGMLAFPTTEWGSETAPAPPVSARWTDLGEVRHTFTHFHLTLRVLLADTSANPSRGAYGALNPQDLPTVFRKAHLLVT